MYPRDMSYLARWLADNQESQTDFMKRTGLSWSSVYRAVHQKRDLDLTTAIRIVIATRGEVPASELTTDAHLLDELAAVLVALKRRRRRRSAGEAAE